MLRNYCSTLAAPLALVKEQFLTTFSILNKFPCSSLQPEKQTKKNLMYAEETLLEILGVCFKLIECYLNIWDLHALLGKFISYY